MTPNEYAAWWWSMRLVKEWAKPAFRTALVELLPDSDWELHCDYDPQDRLLDAIRKAGINCRGWGYSADGIFPRKTCLMRRGQQILAKEGYRSPFIVVYDQGVAG